MKKLIVFFGLVLAIGLFVASNKEIAAQYIYPSPYSQSYYEGVYYYESYYEGTYYYQPYYEGVYYYEGYYESNYYSYPTPEI